MERIKIIQIKSELGAGTRGSSLGVDALEVAAWKKHEDLFNKFPTVVLKDENHLLYTETDTPKAKYIEGVIEIHKRLSAEVNKTLSTDHDFPVILAGDHSSITGSISGVKRAYPDKRLGIIWVDAHGDLHSPFTTPSGNMHGMPLAAVLNIDNLGFKQTEPEEKTVRYWDQIKQLDGIFPKVLKEDVVFFSVRDVEPAEQQLMDEGRMKNFTVSDIRTLGVQACVAQALEKLADCDMIYLSFDVDSMDSEIVSHGTGTPVSKGLVPAEAREILQMLIKSGKICCFDMVEINPVLDDKGNLMAETAFDILKSVITTIENMLNKKEIVVGNGN